MKNKLLMLLQKTEMPRPGKEFNSGIVNLLRFLPEQNRIIKRIMSPD